MVGQWEKIASSVEPVTVSVFLLAYNQESWVAQAIESVFSQSYLVDELIIHDDASSDQTWQVIQDTLARCLTTNPHPVRSWRIHRAPQNRGLIRAFDFHRQAKNDLVVGIAGDDWSHPDRIRKLVDCYLRAGCPKYFLAHSAVVVIDKATGQAQGVWRPPVISYPSLDPLVLADQFALHIGATQAWTKSLYEDFGPIAYTTTYEDLVLGFRAALLNQYHYLDEGLVYYRLGGISWQRPKAEVADRHWRHALLQRACDALCVNRLDVVRKIMETYSAYSNEN